MTEHLPQEIIEQLDKNQLRGEAYIEALLHINSCSECQSRLTIPSPEDILDSLFGDDEPSSDDDNDDRDSESEKKLLYRSWMAKIRKFFKPHNQLIFAIS